MVEWDIDANLPLYTRDYLKLMKKKSEEVMFPSTDKEIYSVQPVSEDVKMILDDQSQLRLNLPRPYSFFVSKEELMTTHPDLINEIQETMRNKGEVMDDEWWDNYTKHLWVLEDSRTGKRVGVESFPNEKRAKETIEYYIKRDAKGKRQDIHELIPFLIAVQVR